MVNGKSTAEGFFASWDIPYFAGCSTFRKPKKEGAFQQGEKATILFCRVGKGLIGFLSIVGKQKLREIP